MQEADKVVWDSHLFKNFPQFVVIHIIKGFGIVNKAEIDVFLELSCWTIVTLNSVVVSHCGFDLHFPMVNVVEHFFICLLAVCMSAFGKMTNSSSSLPLF